MFLLFVSLIPTVCPSKINFLKIRSRVRGLAFYTVISIGEWLCLRRVHLTNKLRFHRSWRYIPNCLPCVWVKGTKRNKKLLSNYCQMLACNVVHFNLHGNPEVSLSPWWQERQLWLRGPRELDQTHLWLNLGGWTCGGYVGSTRPGIQWMLVEWISKRTSICLQHP